MDGTQTVEDFCASVRICIKLYTYERVSFVFTFFLLRLINNRIQMLACVRGRRWSLCTRRATIFILRPSQALWASEFALLILTGYVCSCVVYMYMYVLEFCISSSHSSSFLFFFFILISNLPPATL